MRAALLTICLLLPCLAQQALECEVEGKVTDVVTGEPLRKARVRLLYRSGGASRQYSAVGDAEGRFVMDDVEPGTYQLLGERQGYLGATNMLSRLRAAGWNFNCPRERS